MMTLVWVGSSLDDLRQFPEDVKDVMGYALYLAQMGDKHPDAKPLSGFGGAGVLEIVDEYDGDTYRAVYTLRFADFVYVLQCLPEEVETRHQYAKAGPGAHPPPPEVGGGSLRAAEGTEEVSAENDIPIVQSSGNVFADLGVENPDESLLKAELARQITAQVSARHLTQVEAAELLGLDQPKVSALMRGRLGGFSVERLLRLLLALGIDVEIRVKPKPDSSTRGRLDVVSA